jgi:hypothetical protein
MYQLHIQRRGETSSPIRREAQRSRVLKVVENFGREVIIRETWRIILKWIVKKNVEE